MQQQRSSYLHNNEQVTHKLPIFLVPLSALNLLHNYSNWPTWNLNAAQWSEKFRNDASTYWSKNHFP